MYYRTIVVLPKESKDTAYVSETEIDSPMKKPSSPQKGGNKSGGTNARG
jgi:hypothetical protein